MKAAVYNAMVILVAMTLLGTYALTTVISFPKAYAWGNHEKCDSSDEPPFKDFPGASGPTGNPHTCEQPTGDPHLDEDNPSTGNPHNT